MSKRAESGVGAMAPHLAHSTHNCRALANHRTMSLVVPNVVQISKEQVFSVRNRYFSLRWGSRSVRIRRIRTFLVRSGPGLNDPI
jgi:hypothetical protein